MKARLRERWLQLPLRDRQLCGVLAVFLLIIVCVYGLWLPARQRLETAEALYLKRFAQAGEVQQARPTLAVKVFDQPLSTRLSESAARLGLSVQQFDVDGAVIRISMMGDATTVLGWLHRIEHEGAQFESLSLEKQDSSLQIQLLINNQA